MSTDNIKLFIQTNYSDSQLAALIEHTESGKLSYSSCCCLVGSLTASHALKGAGEFCNFGHFWNALKLPYAVQAEHEFQLSGGADFSDHLRRERLLPILYAERDRRELERELQFELTHCFPEPEYEPEEEYWSDAATTREMVNSIKGR